MSTAALAGACTDEVVYDLNAAQDASAAGSGGTGGGSDASTNDAGGTGGNAGSDAGDAATEAAFEGGNLALCVRLGTELQLKAEFTAFFTAYASRIRRNCDVTLFTDRPLERFANELLSFNQSFWGCVSAPPTTFGIVESGATLTVQDVTVFIELYMEVARARLSLSPSEERIMQGELERLGALAVNSTANTLTYAQTNCDAGARDAGGSDSASDGDAEQANDGSGDASADGAAE